MTDEERLELCTRIREHCRKHGIALDYPPATTGQIRATEQRIGFPLPPMLRLFYTEVANGSPRLGSHSGLFGGVGGYPSSWYGPGSTIDTLTSTSGGRLSERVAAALQRYPGAYLFCKDTPERFITISDEGCGQGLDLDGWTGRLYITGAGVSLADYLSEVGDAEGASQASERDWLASISYLAPSLEFWLECWLADAIHEMIYVSCYWHAPLSQEMLDGTLGTDPASYARWQYDQDRLMSAPDDATESDEYEPSAENQEWYEEHFAFEK